MKVYRRIEDFIGVKNPIVTTGTFDGVHLGHQKILNSLRQIAKEQNGTSVLLTFDPHPRKVLFSEDVDLELITTLDEKIQLLEQFGLEHLIICPFTIEFSKISSLNFIREVMVKQLKAHTLVIGYNHHFGRNREGSFKHLMEFGPIYGFNVCEIPAKDVDSIEVSSTKIRQSILAGDLEIAQSYLGHPFFITGNVVYGKQLGRTIGFPTANIQISQPDKIIPPNGVYWVQVELEGGHYLLNGMMNIGVRPTIDSGERSIEVHLLNWSTEIYGKVLKVNILKRSRSEIKFGSLTLLQEQLHLDLQNANAYFENLTNLKLR